MVPEAVVHRVDKTDISIVSGKMDSQIVICNHTISLEQTAHRKT